MPKTPFTRWSLARIPDANPDTVEEMLTEGWVRFITEPWAGTPDTPGGTRGWWKLARTAPLPGPIEHALLIEMENGWEPIAVEGALVHLRRNGEDLHVPHGAPL